MFNGCSNLTTIFAGNEWSTNAVLSGSNMFTGCTNLVGGAGTAFDASHTDETYAHIDGGTANPGYFTDKNAAPVVDEDLKDDVYTVGESDFSTEFYTQFSKYYQIPQGGKWVSKFKLNLNPNDNRIYKNFVLLITNDEDRGAGQDKEYGAFRYDAVADSTRTNSQWGTSYVFPFRYTTSTLYLEPDENEMDPNVQKLGGLVTLTVDRSQADAFVITMSNEQGVVKTYRQPYVLPNFNNDSTNTNIRCFITVENSQLEFKGSNIEPIGGYSAPVATVEPYAVLSDNNTVLTFYYDENKTSRGGMSVGPFAYETERGWNSNAADITSLVFDESFAEYHPTSTAMWFQSCSNLKSITNIQYLKTDSVTTMEGMFSGCSSLTNIDLSNFNTDKVTSMFAMFSGCSSLMSLDLSKFNTTNVTETGAMFSSCSSLTSLDLSNFNTSNMTNVSSMFAYSTSLKTLDLSGFRFNSVTFLNIRFMFRECIALQTIYVDENWTLPSSINGSSMFEGCTSLVGGAGTTYSADHTDYTYAHIDGGTANPGYFTDKNATPVVTETVAAPSFSWSENDLTISSETQGAEIYFALDTARVAMLVPTDYSNSADEKAAVDWFVKNYVEKGLGELYTPYNNVENLIDRGYSACWVMSDRVGTQQGADNLPGNLGGSYVTNILRRFAEKGGNLLLTNHATQLVSSVGRIAANYAPNIFVSGEGGQNPDVWGIHPVIGNEEGKIYDHRDHPIYANMTYDANTDGGIYPLDGPGIKGDHNSMWNLYDLGLSTEPSVVQNWEETTNSTILGTWNNSAQSSTAGIVDFAPTTNFAGRVLAVGMAAYEWDLGGATNTYQSQLEQFTKNCLTYLGGPTKISDDKYQRYTAPVSVTKDCTIYAYAKKDGMATSDTITLVYPLTAWLELQKTCYLGQEVVYRASRSPRVPEQLVAEAEARIYEGEAMYKQRTAERPEIEKTTNYLLATLEELEAMMRVPASYSNYVLTAEEDATMAEIVDQYGSYYGNQVAAIVWNSSVPMTESDLQQFTSNPNLLIYAQSESLVPANRNNVVINGVAKNVVLTTTATGNCNFYAPQAFTAEAIQYTRTFSQQTQIGVSRGWEAIALPFTVQTYTHADRGVIAPFGNSASENHFWLRELTQNGL